MQVYATDDDMDSSGIVTYETDNDHFAVDQGGVVYNTLPLDYEGTGGKYQFSVYAKNPGKAGHDVHQVDQKVF